MQLIKASTASTLVGLVLFGVLLTFVSALYKVEFTFPPSLQPCVMRIFQVPMKQTSYGFLFFWLVEVEGVYKVGCGPIVDEFITHSVLWPGLFSDIFLCAFCYSLILHLKNKLEARRT